MEIIKIIIILLIGFLFLGIGLLSKNLKNEYLLGEEKVAEVDTTVREAGTYWYELKYLEEGKECRIQTLKYKSTSYKYSTGDKVKIKIAEYTSGAKYALIVDETMVPIVHSSNNIGHIFIPLGIGFVVLGIVVAIKKIF